MTSVVNSSLPAVTGVENGASVIAYLQGNGETWTKLNGNKTKQTQPALAEIRGRVYVGPLAARSYLFCFVKNDSCMCAVSSILCAKASSKLELSNMKMQHVDT